jgi:hypothetical protein
MPSFHPKILRKLPFSYYLYLFVSYDTIMTTANQLTLTEYTQLSEAYGWFNTRLFDGRLPDCLISLQRRFKAGGYFSQGKFSRRRGKRVTAEIALNPDAFIGRTDGHILSTLVHEMVHLWQAEFGRPTRNGYHNEEWAAKMNTVGLIPSATGRPGGMQTGQRMTHYIRTGGPYQRAFNELYRTGFRLHWESCHS